MTEKQPQVRLGDATLSGEAAEGVEVFDAIPYASLPEPFGDAVPLAPGEKPAAGVETLDLTLTRPADTGPGDDLPVAVWIHGGSYVEGDRRDSPRTVLSREGGVIVISLSYRLGARGFVPFTDDEPGRYRGVTDCQLGLEWVQRAVEAFGGDPTRVTLMGHSAGAGIVLWLCRKDHYRGAFRRAMAFSAAYPREHADKRKDLLRRTMRTPVSRRHLTRLWHRDPRAVERRSMRFHNRFLSDVGFGPYPMEPGELNPDIPLVLSCMTHEMHGAPGTAPMDRLAGRLTARVFARRMGVTVPLSTYLGPGEDRPVARLLGDGPIRSWVSRVAEGAPGRRWLLELRRDGGQEAHHGDEIEYVFLRPGPLMNLVRRVMHGEEPGWPEYRDAGERTAYSLALGEGPEAGRTVDDPLRHVRICFGERPEAEGPPILRGKWG